MRRLFSWKLEAPEGEPGHPIEIDIRQLADLVNIHGLPNLPWQLSGENLAPMGYPNQAYRLDDAYLAISNPNKEHIIIRSLLTLADSRGKGQAARLLCALFARFLEKNWIVPAISPEEMNGFFKILTLKCRICHNFKWNWFSTKMQFLNEIGVWEGITLFLCKNIYGGKYRLLVKDW